MSSSPLNLHQYAYQSRKSCDMAIYEVVRRVENTVRCKEITIDVCLDIEDAFDNASTESITKAV